jgi:hypothetical protein
LRRQALRWIKGRREQLPVNQGKSGTL